MSQFGLTFPCTLDNNFSSLKELEGVVNRRKFGSYVCAPDNCPERRLSSSVNGSLRNSNTDSPFTIDIDSDEAKLLLKIDQDALYEGALKKPLSQAPEPLEDTILKMRQRPLKGWHERYFSLSKGHISHAKSQSNLVRGRFTTQLSLANTSVTTDPSKLTIKIDATTLMYKLKFSSLDKYASWLMAIREHRAYNQFQNATLAIETSNDLQQSSSGASNLSADEVFPKQDLLFSQDTERPNTLLKSDSLSAGFELTSYQQLTVLLSGLEESLRDLGSIRECLQEALETATAEEVENDACSPTRSLFFSPIPFMFTDDAMTATTSIHPHPMSPTAQTQDYPKSADLRAPSAGRLESTLKPATEFMEESNNFIDKATEVFATLSRLNNERNAGVSPCKARTQTLTDSNRHSGEDFSDDFNAEIIPVLDESNMDVPDLKDITIKTPEPTPGRRTSLPARQQNLGDFNLMSLLRSNIGRDLSKVRLPVVVNEPLSTLQHLCEEMEYSHLLDAASETTDCAERMLYVTTFAISGYARLANRVSTRPFHALLGETFEYVHNEKQWRFIAEQVSHYPQVAASHCEAKSWTLDQEFSLKNKFWGKSFESTPIGQCRLHLPRFQETYTWGKVTTVLTNLASLTNRLLELEGEVSINCSNGVSSTVKFLKNDSRRANVYRNIHCSVKPPEGSQDPPMTIYGRWDKLLILRNYNDVDRCIWRANPLPANFSTYYGFTQFAMELNEPSQSEAVSSGHLPVTDSRLRPDQRFLELGRVEEAESEKCRLEDDQRRRVRALKSPSNSSSSSNNKWRPLWFTFQPTGPQATSSELGFTYEFNPLYWRYRDSGTFNNLKLPILW